MVPLSLSPQGLRSQVEYMLHGCLLNGCAAEDSEPYGRDLTDLTDDAIQAPTIVFRQVQGGRVQSCQVLCYVEGLV